MATKLTILLFISLLLLIQVNAQSFMGNGDGNGMFGGANGGGMKPHRFQKMRQLFQSMTPTQKMEARNIFMQNRGNRPAMRAAFEAWASRQTGPIQQMYQRYMMAKEMGMLPFQQQQG